MDDVCALKQLVVFLTEEGEVQNASHHAFQVHEEEGKHF